MNLSDSDDTYELSAMNYNGLRYKLDGGTSGGDILAASSDNDFEISKFIALFDISKPDLGFQLIMIFDLVIMMMQ